jgi:hypothetical protein
MRASLMAGLFLISASAIAAVPSGPVLIGGVGDENREAMMQAYKDYNLHLAFAEKTGEFVADVPVTIKDAHGHEVWSGSSEGPMLFAKVPPGRYTVTAEYDGRRQQKSVQVGRKAGRLYTLLW